MRVVLVGSAVERERLRRRIDFALTVVGEFASLAEARAAELDVDAYLLAPNARLKPRAPELLPAPELPPAPGRARAPEREALAERFLEPLTPREIQVLELLAEGLPNKAIAARLGVSDQTVKFHVAALSGKLGAVNRTDAVRRGVRLGLITL